MPNQTTEKEKSATKSQSTNATNGQWASKETYQDLIQRVPDAISRVNASATGIVRDYPIQAALGGLVIGFLLGTLVSRRAS